MTLPLLLTVTGFPPSFPSPFGSVNPASITSLQPSLSESKLNRSTTVAVVVFVGERPSIASWAPLLFASTKPVSFASIIPSPFVS